MQKPRKFRIGEDVVRFYYDGSLGSLPACMPGRRMILITDQHVYRLHRNDFRAWDTIVLRAGEQYKISATIESLVERLIALQADRQTVLVAVGGGVISDLVGYLAAIYMRGLSFGIVPTTLLSMVDASIGGKNGVDVGRYKNMLGTTRQPDFILHDYRLLRTLPEREWSNGFAEVIKHACIADSTLFRQLLQRDLGFYRGNPTALRRLISRNVQLKFGVVQKDPFEKGYRKLLNFGHTLGHALEIQYELSHGEAISLGMIFAAHLSERAYNFGEIESLRNVLTRYGLPQYARFSVDKVMRSLRMDKKRGDASVDYILLKRIGSAVRSPLSFTFIEKQLRAYT